MADVPFGDPYDDEPYPGSSFIPFTLPVIQPIYVPVPMPCPQRASCRCPCCGLDFSGTMGYVCSNTACPIQPKITCTGTSIEIR